MIGDSERSSDFDTCRTVRKPHPECLLSPIGEQRQAILQDFDGAIAREVLSAPTVPLFVQRIGLDDDGRSTLAAQHRHELVVCRPTQIARRRRVTVLYEIFTSQDSKERLLCQIICGRRIASEHSQVAPDAVLVPNDQLLRAELNRRLLIETVHFLRPNHAFYAISSSMTLPPPAIFIGRPFLLVNVLSVEMPSPRHTVVIKSSLLNGSVSTLEPSLLV